MIRALDGDTVLLRLPGRKTETPVRLLGIDAPDTAATRNGVEECGGQQARDALEALSAKWTRTTLRLDPRVGRLDQYGRLQAYVVPLDEPGSTYQEQLLRQGLARPLAYWRKHKFQERFLNASVGAQAVGSGIWSMCAGDFHTPTLPPPADASGPAGDKTIVVASEGFHRAGSWEPSRDGATLADLSRRWGPPASYVDCVADWPDLGVSAATTYYPGNCRRSSSAGEIKHVSATGTGWRTNRGLSIGDDIDRMDALYPNPPEQPFWDDDTGTAYAPLSGYFLGSPDGPLKADLVATVDADTEFVTELGAVRIYGAG